MDRNEMSTLRRFCDFTLNDNKKNTEVKELWGTGTSQFVN